MSSQNEPIAGAADGERAAAQTLAVDHLAAEVIRGLQAAGLSPLLLKGPAIVSILYTDGAPRSYADCDLLFDPDELDAARAELRRQGFERKLALFETELGFSHLGEHHAEVWLRADGANVDLHRFFQLSDPGQASANWVLLSEHTRSLELMGTSVRALDEVGIALLVAVHAANHGRVPQVLSDLERALGLDRETWSRAWALARGLGVEEAFSAGLHLLPSGRELVSVLELRPPSDPNLLLQADSASLAGLSVLRLLDTPGLRAKLRFVLARVFPSPGYMREAHPLARRGRAGLAAAYAWRVLEIAPRIGEALRSSIRAKRAARSARSAIRTKGR